MAINDVTVAQLPAIPSGGITNNTLFHTVEDGSDFRMTMAQLRDFTKYALADEPEVTENSLTSSTKLMVDPGTQSKISLSELVSYMEANISQPLRRALQQRTNILDIPETVWTRIGEVTLNTAEPGWVEYGVAIRYTFNSTTNSARVRYSVDNGVNWEYMTRENKDNNDSEPFYYAYPFKVLIATTLTILLDIQKEDGVGVLNVLDATTWIKEENYE